MSDTYADLRKAQAEIEEQERAKRSEAHRPSNIASLKVEQANSPKLEQANAPHSAPPAAPARERGRSREESSPEPPKTPTPGAAALVPPSWEQKKADDEREVLVRKNQYAETIKSGDHESAQKMEDGLADRMKASGSDRVEINNFRHSLRGRDEADMVRNFAQADSDQTTKERRAGMSREDQQAEKQQEFAAYVARRHSGKKSGEQDQQQIGKRQKSPAEIERIAKFQTQNRAAAVTKELDNDHTKGPKR